VPHAQANLAKIPDELADDQVVLLTDIASTGISAAESADLQIGDTVAVFAQGTSRMRFSPACAHRASPTSCESDAGVHSKVDAP
jgi:hypothetical protein